MRNTPNIRIQRFKAGQRRLSAGHLNQLVDGVNRLSSGINPAIQPRVFGRSGAAVQVLTLVTHEDDHLVCEDEDENTVYVAKVYELRRTPFDGETIDGVTYTYTSASEREADNGVDDPETQFITPDYRAGAEIYASKVIGETGLYVDPEADPLVPITYIELNQGRAWAWDEPPP